MEAGNTQGFPRSSSHFIQNYLEQLSDVQFRKIIKMYFIDFKIFDYPVPTQKDTFYQ